MKRAARIGTGLALCALIGVLPVASCTDAADTPDGGSRDGAAVQDALPPLSPDAMLPGSYCALPGSLVSTPAGMAVVAGGDASLPDLSWLTLPVGFCLHHFATVPETRQLRVSPSGDLFVASPSHATAGGEQNYGVGAILVLPDDDHDGLADSMLTFLGNLPMTQGLTFAPDHYFYFQDATEIKRVPFKMGDRAPSAPVEVVTTITATQMTNHWPKSVDMATDGTLYVTNGSDQGEACLSPASNPPVIGAIFKVGADGQPSLVSQGFRNPIAMRCEATHPICLAAELARDGSAGTGGREKIVPVRQGDNWGFPCCATNDVPYEGMEFQDTSGPNAGVIVQPTDCASVTPESVSFEIGDTPFSIDFEPGNWPAPWTDRAFVALHGAVGSFSGSRVVAIALDPVTGLPLESTDLPPNATDPNMTDFVSGWSQARHQRATAIAFGPDGRIYVGDDNSGEILWIAPTTLLRP